MSRRRGIPTPGCSASGCAATICAPRSAAREPGFLVDVSGSMASRTGCRWSSARYPLLADQLQPQRPGVDRRLCGFSRPRPCAHRRSGASQGAALSRFEAGGSTAGGQGLELAYHRARDNRIADGINRILLATDGDFNVGISDTSADPTWSSRHRDNGITLTTLGFGQGNYNEAMMEQVADHGNGNYAYIDSAMEARKVLGQQTELDPVHHRQGRQDPGRVQPGTSRRIPPDRLREPRCCARRISTTTRSMPAISAPGHMVTALYEIVPVGAKGWLAERRYEPTGRKGRGRKGRPGRAGNSPSSSFATNCPTGQLASDPAAGPRIGDRRRAGSRRRLGLRRRGRGLRAEAEAGRVYRRISAGTGFARLAGPVQDYWRQEFLKLVDLAAAQDPAAAPT